VLNAIDEELLLRSSHKPRASASKHRNDGNDRSPDKRNHKGGDVVDSYEYYGRQ